MRALWFCLIVSCGAPAGPGASIPDDERPRHRHGHCHEGVTPSCHDHFHGPEHHTAEAPR